MSLVRVQLPEPFWGLMELSISPRFISSDIRSFGGNWMVGLIDRRKIVQWGSRDLIAFRALQPNGKPPDGLQTYSLAQADISLGTKVICLGFPKDHALHVDEGENRVTVRAVTGFVVTGYADEAEFNSPIIRGMSGGPVVVGKQFVGVAYLNRQVALDAYKTEEAESVTEGGVERREVYEYRESARWGVFYKSTAFSSWVSGVVEANSAA